MRRSRLHLNFPKRSEITFQYLNFSPFLVQNHWKYDGNLWTLVRTPSPSRTCQQSFHFRILWKQQKLPMHARGKENRALKGKDNFSCLWCFPSCSFLLLHFHLSSSWRRKVCQRARKILLRKENFQVTHEISWHLCRASFWSFSVKTSFMKQFQWINKLKVSSSLEIFCLILCLLKSSKKFFACWCLRRETSLED